LEYITNIIALVCCQKTSLLSPDELTITTDIYSPSIQFLMQNDEQTVLSWYTWQKRYTSIIMMV